MVVTAVPRLAGMAATEAPAVTEDRLSAVLVSAVPAERGFSLTVSSLILATSV
jgi:hypothetical protein